MGLLMLATACGLAGWRVLRPPQAGSAAPVAAPWVAASSTSVPALAAEAARSIAASAVQPQASGSAGAESKEFVEVCGFGRVKRADMDGKSEEPPPWAQVWERQAEEGRASLLRRLEAGSPGQRISAAVLRDDVQAAAALAATTTDAAAYRLALSACRNDATRRFAFARPPLPPASNPSGVFLTEPQAPGPLPTACAALTLERLELLNPGDAWPWQARMQDSQQRGDAAGVSQALYQFAQRARTAPPFRPLSIAMAEVAAAEPTPEEAMALMMVLGKDMVIMQSPHFEISRACRPETLGDANRRQLCEQAVRRLPEMTTELIEASLLYRLEERVGLAHSAKALQRDEGNRVLEAMAADSMRWLKEPSCGSLSRMGRQLALLARQGELAYARTVMKDRPASAPP
ncbi:hypothetical protein ASC95_22005 [Pelomonas sp. Root1217]|uniref:hypothetical protein n=1 Tax=Pelomonas sp. Root1217 TaxID=1736430 RepID=UPI000709FEC6|nr:hypothetical protein [Pelomonas sp. Root1217]KQV48591.1 hypothetical protein ASC95_22005 [Pelomonas sp. Root1217]